MNTNKSNCLHKNPATVSTFAQTSSTTNGRLGLLAGLIALTCVLAACSNTKNTQTSAFAPTESITNSATADAIFGPALSLFEENQVENTGNAGQNFAPVPGTSVDSGNSVAALVENLPENSAGAAHISNKTKFSSAAFGVAGSPRLTTSRNVRKGGGRYQVGKPYTIRGKRYVPREDPGYDAVGLASWYGPNFHGRLTANGEIYDQYALSAAHPTLPLPSYVKVTNVENGASVTVRVNDRGPYSKGRIIDLSARAAQLLGYTKKGVAKVRVQYAGRARMDGLDGEKLLASYNPGNLDPNQIASLAKQPVQVASAEVAKAKPVKSLQAVSRSEPKPVVRQQPVQQASITAQPGKPTQQTAPLPPAPVPVEPVGVKIDAGRFGAPLPSLVTGYTGDESSPASQAISGLASAQPAGEETQGYGSGDLRRFLIGPVGPLESAEKLVDALSGYGPVSVFEGGDAQNYLLVSFAQEDAALVTGIIRKDGYAFSSQ